MTPKTKKNFKILTPHAALLVWNYNDRITGDPEGDIDEEGINFTLISTVSCISISTNKSKGAPAGSFQAVLAPFKNWVSTLTSGSWCAILMSNKPITSDSIKRADPEQVKMFGKIESVRVDTSTAQDGTRQTRFMVSGTDWGHIFNNVLYIDNLIFNDGLQKDTLGNQAAIAMRNALLGERNVPKNFAVKTNLATLMNIFGANLDGFSAKGDAIGRIAKSSYDFVLPKEVADFFQFVRPTIRQEYEDPRDHRSKESSKALTPIEESKLRNTDAVANTQQVRVITKLLNLQTGKLVEPNKYNEIVDSYGFLDPFSLQGTNTFWQILLDNSNPALNEMYNEINWSKEGPRLTIFNRIKPFSFKKYQNKPNFLRSMFEYIKYHDLDSVSVLSINAGTNWRDKFNFIEVKPQFQEFNILDNWTKTKTQLSDKAAFNREGFRPYMVGTKQFPGSPTNGASAAFNADQLATWVQLMSEWYFDTHRLLNGTLTITGQNEYIAVGDNIRFDANLINPTPNMSSAGSKARTSKLVLAHVEGISHNFSISEDGSRVFTTTIQFVRGVFVNSSNELFGEGSLDQFTEDLSQDEERNRLNVLTTSEKDDPDEKQHGT